MDDDTKPQTFAPELGMPVLFKDGGGVRPAVVVSIVSDTSANLMVFFDPVVDAYEVNHKGRTCYPKIGAVLVDFVDGRPVFS